jgi:hypothetical protein
VSCPVPAARDHAWSGHPARHKACGDRVLRLADNLRQFRVTESDLLGKKMRSVPHVHFEAFNQAGKIIENLHLPIIP